MVSINILIVFGKLLNFPDTDVIMSTAQPVCKKRKPNQCYPLGVGFCPVGSEPTKEPKKVCFRQISV